MTISNILPYVQLKGSPGEIGLEHGRLFQQRIETSYEFYTAGLMKHADLDFKRLGNEYLDCIGAYSDAYFDEINGIAMGSSMEPWQIGVLNARTEIFLRSNPKKIPQECTAVYFPKGRLLGQNWDWIAICEELIVLTEIQRKGAPKILTMTEPGIIGKIGMNENGLGVCLNFLLGNSSQPALPIHVLLRAVLDSHSLEDAFECIESAPYHAACNLMLADADGNYRDIELNGSRLNLVDFGQEIPIHTNHYLCEDCLDRSDPGYESTITRQRRGRQLCSELCDQSLASMKAVLLDRENGENAICKSYSPFIGFDYGTICTLIMNLPEREMSITKGPPHDHEFETLKITSSV